MNDAQQPRQELETADIACLMKLLPHRYPFLLVDRMFDMDRDESAVKRCKPGRDPREEG